MALVWVLTAVDIVRRHLGAKRTAGWLLIVVVLPFAGAVVLGLRERLPAEAEREAHVAHELEHGAPRPPLERTRTGG